MNHARRLVLDRFGPPLESLRLEEIPLPPPAPGEISVRMERASVNPADLNVIEGTYGTKPPLPAVPGNEGAGIVESCGPGVTTPSPGDRVAVPGLGTWTSRILMPAERCTLVPPTVTPEFAAMLTVNPPTAWCLLHRYISLPPGAWIIQNASTSAVGRCVIQIARAIGWKTLNLVRRPEAIAELTALGADAVEVEDPTLPKRLATITGGAPIRLGLNAVGGESAATLAKCLAPDAHLVTYGAMSRQPLKIANGLLIFNNLTCHGFWMTRLYRSLTPQEKSTMFSRLIDLHLRGNLTIPIDTVIPLTRWQEAIRRATAEARPGKVLFDLQN